MLKGYRGIIIFYTLMVLTICFIAINYLLPNYGLTKAELEYLQDLEKIVVVGDGYYPPFGFEENGTYVGYEVDLIEMLSQKLGVELVYQPMIWADAKDAILRGEAHILTGMRVTPERTEKYLFTKPYMDTYFSFVSKVEIEEVGDIAGKKIVLQKGSQTISVLEDFEVLEIIEVSSPMDALEILVLEQADIWIENHQVASFYLNNSDAELIYDLTEYKITPLNDTHGDYAMAVSKDFPQLLSILDKAITGLEAEGMLKNLDLKWFGGVIPRDSQDMKMWLILLLIIFIFTTIGCLLAIYSETLRFKVKEKTKELEEHNIKLKNFTLNTAHAFGSAIEFKDIYTGGHSQRVAEISSTIGQKIGLGEEELFQLYLGALIHDVGKVGIPDEILRKPGSLTNEEYDMIKQHPNIGEAILSHIAGYELIREIVLYHHERYDGGQGAYPGQRKGDEIPIAARIVTIADAYDAMTSSRPYRAALTKEVAVSRILDDSGKQFDPKLVEVFLSILKDHQDL